MSLAKLYEKKKTWKWIHPVCPSLEATSKTQLRELREEDRRWTVSLLVRETKRIVVRKKRLSMEPLCFNKIINSTDGTKQVPLYSRIIESNKKETANLSVRVAGGNEEPNRRNFTI